MLGNWFYHERIRKAVAVFGSLFNNIYVVRHNAAGETINQTKVPLSYAPRRDFIDRIQAMDAGDQQERQIAIKLPRMSFEILAIQYDAQRQLSKVNKRVIPQAGENARQIYTPVPYNLTFQLNVYARSQDDALQIVEQILPYFTPQYTVAVKPLEGFDLQEDTPIRLDGVVMQDDYEAALEARRTIIYTLDFEMKLNLYKLVESASSIIRTAETSLLDFDTGGLLAFCKVESNILSGDSAELSSIAEDAGSTATNTISLVNTLNDIEGYSILTQPEFGTAVVDSDGKWTYTPNSDAYGADSFIIGVDVGQNVTESVTVQVRASGLPGVDDAIDDTFTYYNQDGSAFTFDVSTNDEWESTGTVTHTVENQPAQGTVAIVDSLAGTFSYTPPSAAFTGVVTFEYRAVPEGAENSSEVGEVTITVLEGYSYTVSVPNAIEDETIQATITSNYAINQTVTYTITGDNNTNGRISTTSGSVVMDALTKTVDIVIGQPAGEQGTVTSTFTINDAAAGVTESDTFDILDTYPPATYQASTPTNNGDFGYAIDTSDTYAVIGEPGNDSAYLRTIADGTTVELVPSGGVQTANFGRAVAIEGSQVLVSALNTSNGQATVYLFDTSGNLLNVWDDTGNARFGFELFFTENYIGITHPRAGSASGGIIYFYDRSSPYSLIYTKDYGGSTNNYVGTSVASSPYAEDYVVALPGRSSAGRVIKVSGGTLQFNNFLDTHDNTASIWNSHYDPTNTFTNGPTSVAMSNNHIFLGVPNLNRVSVWRYADPLNGRFGSLGATPTTPRIDGSFAVSASGAQIDLGAQAPDLISGRTDPENMSVGEYSGTLRRSATNTWYGANGGIAWIRNKDTDEYIICRLARDMQAFGFPAVPQYPTSVRTRTVNWTIDGSEPGGSPAIPGYTGDGTYNLQISMIVQFSHLITLTGQSGETDIDFGRYVAVNPNSTELYVAAPLESWSGENRGTIYKFALDDTVDVGFDRTLASDTIATLNGYFRGEVNDYLGFGTTSQSYFYGQVTNSSNYNAGSPAQISTNGNFVKIGNNEFASNQGRVLENQSFTDEITFSGSHTYDPEFGWCVAILNVDTTYESATRTKQDFGIPADGLTMTLDSIMRDADYAQVMNDATYITFDIVDPSGSPQNTLPSQRETNGVVFTKAAITTEPNVSGTNLTNAENLGRETIKSGIRTFWHDEDVGDDFNTNDQSGFVFRSNQLRLYGNSALGSNEVQQRGNTGQATGTSTGDYVNWGNNQYLLVWVTNSPTAPVLKAAP